MKQYFEIVDVLAREILYREKDTEGIWEFFKLALKTGK